ncbi:MAG: TOBE domain-containing protein [Acidimicrobiales bacterium]
MTTFGIGRAADLVGVSVDTLRRWADAGRVATTRTPGGRREIDGTALAELARTMAVEPRSGDIVAASARNRFTGIVTRVVTDTVMAQVELQAGPHRVVALLSREAVDELGLAPGMLAVASVKATSVVVELPAQP